MLPLAARVLIFTLFIWGAYVILRRARASRSNNQLGPIPFRSAITKISDPLDGAIALMVAVARMDTVGKVSDAQLQTIHQNLQEQMQLSLTDAQKRTHRIRDFSRHLNRAQSVIVPALRTLKEKLTRSEIEDLLAMMTKVAEIENPVNKDQTEFMAIVRDELTGAKTNPGYHLAQLNIASFREPAMSTVNKDFHGAIDSVNAVAESQPGFVWRLVDDGPARAGISLFENPDMLVNLSVWTDMESLMKFVYRTPEHRAIMRRREEWFDHVDINMVLWWVKAGETPSLKDAAEKLDLLAAQGPSEDAFTFKHHFPAPYLGTEKTV